MSTPSAATSHRPFLAGARRPAVFLDRDGVLNAAIVRAGRPYSPATLAQLKVLEDAPAALATLHGAGFALVVVTNQPDVARGTQSVAAVQAINDALCAQLPIDALYVCTHDDGDGCSCRKPLPGSLYRAERDLDLDLTRSYLVGDRWRDIAAGHAAGVRTIFVDRGYAERRPDPAPDAIVAQTGDAAAWIVRDAATRASASFAARR